MPKLMLITDSLDAAKASGMPPTPGRVYVENPGTADARIVPKFPVSFRSDVRATRTIWVEGADFLPDALQTVDTVYEFGRSLIESGIINPTILFNVEHYSQPRRWREWRSFRRNFVEPLAELGYADVGCFTAINVGPEENQNDWHAWEDVPRAVLHLYDIAPSRLNAARVVAAMDANPNAVVLIRENDPNVAQMVAVARQRGHDVILWDAWIDTPGGSKRPLTPAERAAQNTATAALYAQRGR